MMVDFVKLSSKGQFTLPISMRRSLGLKRGNRLALERVGDFVLMRKVELDFEEKLELLQQHAQERGVDREEIFATLRDVRREIQSERESS